MIWVAGRLVPEEDLTISVRDRTFEHGLGLFETLRTWNGSAPLLDRHRNRLTRSARTLGLTLDPASLPGPQAVADLLQAEGRAEDAMLRITASGGQTEHPASVVWMRASALPTPATNKGVHLAIVPWSAHPNDPLARHKTLNYGSRRAAYELARSRGADEALMMSTEGRFWEGSRTNLFLIKGDSLTTPSLEGPLVPGIMRELVLEQARHLPLEVLEVPFVTRSVLDEADEVFVTNSVRGILPVASLDHREWPAPGSWTLRLAAKVADWLGARGPTP